MGRTEELKLATTAPRPPTLQLDALTPQDPSLTLQWISPQAKAAGQAQPGHSPAAGAASQKAERASSGETEPGRRGGTSEIPGTGQTQRRGMCVGAEGVLWAGSPTRGHSGVCVWGLFLFLVSELHRDRCKPQYSRWAAHRTTLKAMLGMVGDTDV